MGTSILEEDIRWLRDTGGTLKLAEGQDSGSGRRGLPGDYLHNHTAGAGGCCIRWNVRLFAFKVLRDSGNGSGEEERGHAYPW